MTFPIQGDAALPLAILFGALFGWLLQKGKVTDYNTILRQFTFKDFRVLKIMLTAIIVGGIGVYLMKDAGLVKYHIKDANMLGVALGASIFGIGMVLYGYCPGTGLAAIGTGSVHALVGGVGMLAGGIVYALNFDWVKANILSVAAWGKIRLPDVTGIPDLGWFALLIVVALVLHKLAPKTA